MKKYPLNIVDYYSTFRDFVEGIAEKYGDKPAISWFSRKQEEQGKTYNQLRDDVRCLQAMLVQMNLAGKHIAIMGENSYEWLVVYFAATYCGATAVCIDIEQPDETILQMLEGADVDVVFVSSAYEDICKKYAGEQRPMFSISGRSTTLKSVKELVEDGKAVWESGSVQEGSETGVDPDATAAIVFTSGTTNYSKPVMLSQKAILTNASDALANVQMGDKAFTSLPFYHTYGLTGSVVAMLILGTHLYINGNLKTVMRDIQLAKPNTLLAVPLMLETIHNKIWVQAEESGKADGLRKLLWIRKILFSLGIKKSGKTLAGVREKAFGAIRLILSGGAHMSSEIMEELSYMGLTVIQGYGITECGPFVSANRNHANKIGSVGTVMAHCEVKLEDGEILVRGDNVMKGYYKAPELTESVMKDGWFCTGDMGEIDKDGYLYITGRKKNLIVLKNGKKVSPEKLEEKIKKLPLVQDVVVYGAASGGSTDDVQVAASIYPNQERTENMTSYEILENLQAGINEINNTLPIYQQIQMVNIREQEFSKTAIQKIKRHLI